MSRNSNAYRHTCQQCGVTFFTSRVEAKTCSNKCRVKMHRENKAGNGKTWHNVKPEFGAMAMDIKNVSETAYSHINELLTVYGARATELAISACWYSLTDCLQKIDEGKL